MKESHKTHRHRQSRLQASHANSSGRSRTADHLLPMESEKRAQVFEKGAWKVWMPEALLRERLLKHHRLCARSPAR